jgi:hypothetical protein
VRQAVCWNQFELLEHGVISHLDSASHHHCDVQDLLQCWGREVLSQRPYFPNLAPCDYWLLAHMKELLWGKRFEADDGISTAVNASLRCPSKIYTATVDNLPCRWEKCVDSAMDNIE